MIWLMELLHVDSQAELVWVAFGLIAQLMFLSLIHI